MNYYSEWQKDFSNLPDYYQTFNRNYDAAIGRWISVDPKAESAESITSYQYANNNPVMFNDPLGDLTEAQWQNVLNIYYNGPITENYQFTDPGDGGGGGDGGGSGGGGGGGGGPTSDSGAILSDKDAFRAGADYLDKFNAWGKSYDNGNIQFAKSYDAAVFAYDVSILGTGKEVLTTARFGGIMLPEVHITAWSQLSAAVEASYNSYWAKQGGMSLSSQGLQFIANNEGFPRHQPYNDPLGYPTAGYGHLLHKSPFTAADVSKYGGMTRAQGMVLLNQDVASRVAAVNNLVQVPLSQNQFDALVDFTFNVGEGAFGKSTLLRQINAGDFSGVSTQLLRWTNGGNAGLIERRNVEINLFVNGVY